MRMAADTASDRNISGDVCEGFILMDSLEREIRDHGDAIWAEAAFAIDTWRGGVSRSEPFESGRHGSGTTARSVALRGGLIEGHTSVGITRMPIVDRSEARITETAATSRQGRSVASFFRADERARGVRCRPSARARPRSRNMIAGLKACATGV